MQQQRKLFHKATVKKFKAFWTSEISDAVKQRQKARKTAEKDPSTQNKREYNKLTAKVRHLTKSAKQEAWKNNCKKLDLNYREGHKTWRLRNNLEGKSIKTNPQPLIQDGKEIVCDKRKAEEFNKYFANVNKQERRDTLDSHLWRAAKKNNPAPRHKHMAFETPFNLAELNTALKRLKNNKVPGSDNIKNELLKNLGGKGKLVLLALINRTWGEGYLPSSWRTAIICPILKKDKLSKVAKRIINNRLYCWLENKQLLTDRQAGFRRGCRAEDQLFRLVQSTLQGFKEGKHTFGVFVDLQQAYDKVWKKGLLVKMHRMGIHGCMFNWIQAFLSNKTIATRYNGATSSKRTLEEGLPQGSSLSCTLFLIYINDLAEQLNISKAMFADDLVIWTTDKYSGIRIKSTPRDRKKLLTLSKVDFIQFQGRKTKCY